MIGKFFRAIFEALFGQFREGFREKRAEKAQRDLGTADAVARGKEKVDEVAEKQAAARADRPSDDERLDRLRRHEG